MRSKPSIKTYKDYAKSKGGKCLSNDIKYAHSKLKWQCKNGHTWKAQATNVIRGSWCPACAGNIKNTLDKMKEVAKARGGVCLSHKYVNSITKLKWKCKRGHIWETTYSSIRIGRWCPKCAIIDRKVTTKRHNIEIAKKIAKERGGNCLSESYKNAHTNLKWICKYGHKWQASLHSVKNGGSWCPTCSGRKVKRDISDLQLLASKRGGKCLSKSYKSSHKLLTWQCEKGHVWKATFTNVKKGSWCPTCSSKRTGDLQRGSLEEAKNEAIRRGGECISAKYIKANTKMLWRCSVGHEWGATLSKIRRGRWCPYCAQGRSEKLVRELFKLIFGAKFIKCRPKWLTYKGERLELDGYNKNLKIAFEYQGAQHYEKIDYFTKTMSHSKRKKIDDFKLKICKQKNILLITIPHTVDQKNMQKYILNKARQGGYPNDKMYNEKIDIFKLPPYKRSDEKYLNNLASKKGGRCLSNYMRGTTYHVEWECKKGHRWLATPVNVRKGHWCPYCAGNIKKSIEDMQKLADKRNGKCLSKEYINTNTKLEWQCEQGHKWFAIPDSIRRGTWCPYCSRRRKV